MRATDLLKCTVLDRDGEDLGPVRDIRVRRDAGGALTIIGLVVGRGPFAHPAHAWGFAEGRAQGPWLFRALTSRATRAARFVPARQIENWEANAVRLRVPARDLEALHPEHES